MTDIARSLPTECPECHGWGETPETAREMVHDGGTHEWRTTIMGYGCPKCGGTGQLEKMHE